MCNGSEIYWFRKQGGRMMYMRVVKLPETCCGCADALQCLSGIKGVTGRSEHKEGESCLGGGEAQQQHRHDERQRQRHCYILPPTSHAVVMPGDLMLESNICTHGPTIKASYDGNEVLLTLVEAHRRWNLSYAPDQRADGHAACTMLLTDVGAEDRDGIPIKESTKATINLYSRGEEDVD